MHDHLVVTSDIDIAGVPFCLQYQYGDDKSKLIFTWERKGSDTLGLGALASTLNGTPMDFPVPGQMEDLKIVLSSIRLQYDFKKNTFAFRLEAERYGSLTVLCDRQNAGMILSFILQMRSKFLLNSLPVFGGSFTQEDYVALQEFKVIFARTKDKEIKITLGIKLSWKLLGEEIILCLPEDSSGYRLDISEKGEQPEQDEAVKYLDINKEFGPFRLSRVGFALGDGSVTLYVDAGIHLSMVLLEFIGLYLSIPLSVDKKVDYGMKGVALSVSKPPLEISGGLTLDKSGGMMLYTGEVLIQFKGIGVTALCSYGQFSQGEASLFAFFLVSARIGGPPIFYITGLAGGFGYNRSITLPDKVKEVESFPFVAAALEKGNLKKGMTPAEVLVKTNQVIKPAEGQYFFSAGVRFQSFGLLESFLLCNVEFGERFLVSILGISRLSLPSASKDPFVYIRLALKAVFAPQDGVIRIEGALVDDSYILNKNCKVNGGFACYIWFGDSEYAGDFVITLGGYQSGYQVPHYPRVDRLSVNWKMDSHLTLTAEAYFALTPACIMLGGNLALVYENGRLRAWFKAWAEFHMQWEPFYYDVSVGISIGASYRWDFFPFYKTFKVELGANLQLWGPPFGGKVRIDWFIISFTISFGKGKPAGTDLDWKEFADIFLPEQPRELQEDDKTDQAAVRDVLTIRPVAGVLQSGEKTGLYLLDADVMEVEITSRIMSTELFYEDEKVAGYQGTLGIVPMGVEKLGSRLTVKLTDEAGRPVTSIQAQPIYTNAPKALWNAGKPQKWETNNLLRQVPFGIRLVSKESSPSGILPKKGSYDMEILCANERLEPRKFSWGEPSRIDGKSYPEENVLEQVERSIAVTGGNRKTMLEALSIVFGVWTEDMLELENWTKDLDKQLDAEPILAVIGAETLK